MNCKLESDIETMITRRILAYHELLIKTNQIKRVSLSGPFANHLLSHCIHSERKHLYDQPEGLALPKDDPLPPN